MERLKSDDAVSAFFKQLSSRWARGGAWVGERGPHGRGWRWWRTAPCIRCMMQRGHTWRMMQWPSGPRPEPAIRADGSHACYLFYSGTRGLLQRNTSTRDPPNPNSQTQPCSYPELVAPLITERDLYLAWSLKRSKAVCGTGTVVGVVGRGHLRGVAHALLRDRGGAGLRFSDLVEGRNSRRVRRRAAAEGAARLAAELALGAGAYVAWLAYNGEL